MVGHRLPARPEGGPPPCRRKEARAREGSDSGDSEPAGEAAKRARHAAEPAVDSGTVPSGSRAEKEIEEGSVDDEGGMRKGRKRRPCADRAQGEEIEERRIVLDAIKRADPAVKPAVDSGTLPTGSRVEKEIEEGSVDDVEAENIEKDPHHMHMNFIARDVKTGLEKTFFAELFMFNDVDDGNSGYVTTACEIIDCNSSGGLRMKGFPDGKFPPDYYDGENCYSCTERIKHPPGTVYRAGLDVLGYVHALDSVQPELLISVLAVTELVLHYFDQKIAGVLQLINLSCELMGLGEYKPALWRFTWKDRFIDDQHGKPASVLAACKDQTGLGDLAAKDAILKKDPVWSKKTKVHRCFHMIKERGAVTVATKANPQETQVSYKVRRYEGFEMGTEGAINASLKQFMRVGHMVGVFPVESRSWTSSSCGGWEDVSRGFGYFSEEWDAAIMNKNEFDMDTDMTEKEGNGVRHRG
ncbi:uncharacterized protein C2845_PM07G05510 [Panicum miliaceum]|uniref:DUF3615 domain-containing protein n=1 Tax=Panicum miliaceum TaxID=4540 RepID=A0A3L6SRZ8_PANMI|nr:uncharacterized protein C2845_PM07G05510 [Panicum miliaceum]